MISFRCNGCGKAYKVKAQHGGKTIRCPGCKVQIVLPFGMATVTPAKAPTSLARSAFPKPAVQIPALQHPVFPVAAQVKLSIDQPQKTGTQGFFRAFGITSGVMAAIAVAGSGLTLLGCGGFLTLAFLIAPSENVRNRMLVEQPARNPEVASFGTTVSPQTNQDNRRAWRCLSYNSVYTQKDERTWIETYSDTGRFKFEMEYKGRTDEYVELFIAAKGELIRLYNDRIEAKQARGWVAFGTGRWDSVNQNTNVANRSAKSPQASSGQPSAQILNVKIVREPNANGRSIRVIKITWKNTGSKPIRALDGNFFIADNTGTLPAKFEYTIFACSNLEDGVMPGETFVLTEGGFALPDGCTVSEAKVEITKILEKSTF